MKTFNDIKFIVSKFPNESGIIGTLVLTEKYSIKVELTSTSVGNEYGNWCVSLLEEGQKIKEYVNLSNSDMLHTIVVIQENMSRGSEF